MELRDRMKIEALEEANLAPYALRAAHSRGRKHAEPEHRYRPSFQRDRDRIIHSDAFRRLEYKTQVFVNWEGDHFRTRLTHSIEVAQCARTMARAMGLNEDVSEAVALAHDLGHTPFGHAGETAMRECMENHGGYEHNRQSLRVVERLERRYPDWNGLNLTFEVRHGLMKHETDYDEPDDSEEASKLGPTLEAQLVNFADEISYNAHDAEDGLYSRILTPEDGSEAELFEQALRAATDAGVRDDRARLRYFIVGYLKNVQVTDLMEASIQRVNDSGIKTLEDVYAYEGPRLIAFSPEMAKHVKGLKHMLYSKLYRNRRVLRSLEKATRFMKAIFERYLSEPYLMPGGFHNRIEKDGENPHRVVCDYIAGMTDRYALDQYRKLFDPNVW